MRELVVTATEVKKVRTRSKANELTGASSTIEGTAVVFTGTLIKDSITWVFADPHDAQRYSVGKVYKITVAEG